MLFVYVLMLTSGLCAGSERQIIDLTHPFHEGFTISWPWFEPFRFFVKARGKTAEGFYLEHNDFSQPEHCGTHSDAPAHFAEGRWRIGQIPIEKLIGPGVVIDITERAKENPDTTVTVADLEAWEEEHGEIPEGAVVIMRSGYGLKYGDKPAYLGWPPGTEKTNPKDTENLHFPGFGGDAAKWLVENRKINGVAVDVISIDHGQSKSFSAHLAFSEANIWGVENLANAEKLPASGFTVYNMVHRLKEGSGAPTRIFAVVGDDLDSNRVPAFISNQFVIVVAIVLSIFIR